MESWEEEDWNTTLEESRILDSQDLKMKWFILKTKKNQNTQSKSMSKFRNPQENFIKLNFDGLPKETQDQLDLEGYSWIAKDAQDGSMWIEEVL